MTSTANLADAFDAQCRRAADRSAVHDGAGRLSYGDLLRWSEAISATLASHVRPGQRVALAFPNSPAFVAGFFAAARVGGVVAPLNPGYRPPELLSHLGGLDPAAIVVDASLLETLRDVAARLARPPAIVEIGDPARIVLVDRGGGEASVAPTSGSPPLLQLYTSGSTGAPKWVVRSHANLLAELAALRQAFALVPEDRFLGAAPFFHVNGLCRTVLASMYVGATLYPVREFRRREILGLLTKERITFLGAVPQIFILLAETPVREEVDLSALRVAFSASAPLLPTSHRKFQEKYGVAIRQLYGSTETGTISVNLHPDPASCPESVGTALEGVTVNVLDEGGHVLPPGQEGELTITSPFAAFEYLGNPAATVNAFRAGAYFSGDLGTKDADGAIRITGRKKFLINRGGFKVNPYEVEAVIKEYPKVRDAVVFGTPGPHGDDLVCCYIVASEECTTEEILLHCRDRIADFKVPSRIEFRPSLPTSSTGKILRAGL
ncbi:MAG TPA: class I adenylate-forming enzyme family protein [Methylomirabilota bacterium]|nr:class I adenylate-forming enzyme family protein [Methylomirabilota bacterium]